MVNLPAPFSGILRCKLLFENPSEIEKLERLSASTPGVALWIKRDDCNSGLSHGGNKSRKLEYVLHDAITKGANTLVTVGGVQSNHMRQVTAAAARYGLQTILIPMDLVDNRSDEYHNLGNVQLTRLMSAEFYRGSPSEVVMHQLSEKGLRPYFIPAGASDHPLGGLGYARWAFEVREQELQQNIFYDTIIVAVASGSTLGGMVAGFKLLEMMSEGSRLRQSRKRTLIGIEAYTVPKHDLVQTVLRIARTTAGHLGLSASNINESDFVVDDRFTGPAYGEVDPLTVSYIKEVAATEGILLDPVYTGKAMAGMLTMTRNCELSQSRNVLFCHTGGQVSLSAYPSVV